MPEDHCHSRSSADHTLHFHALFTSSLALLYAFPSTGREQAGITEWQKSNIYGGARTPRTGHMTAGLCRSNFLPHALQRRVRWAASGRKDSVCCWRNAAGNGRVFTVFAPVCLPCWFSTCCLFVYRKISSSYSANHQTNSAFATNCMNCM